jgi:hypothetical protein
MDVFQECHVKRSQPRSRNRVYVTRLIVEDEIKFRHPASQSSFVRAMLLLPALLAVGGRGEFSPLAQLA